MLCDLGEFSSFLEPQFIISKGSKLSLPRNPVCQNSGKLLCLSGCLTLESSHLEEQGPVVAKLQPKLHVAWSLMGVIDPELGGHQDGAPSFPRSAPFCLSTCRGAGSLITWAPSTVCGLCRAVPRGLCLSCLSGYPSSALPPTNVYPFLLCAYISE